QAAVTALLATPSAATLAAAREAWVAARVPYDQTDAFRFYGGPIDDEARGNLEGRMNAWPMDESFVDYVEGRADAGLIHQPARLPTITGAAIVALNEDGGETNIASGWHAVEFLLWGQDLSATGPGARPYTDFVVGAGSTGGNPERRRDYLRAVTDQLVADLTTVRDAWAPGVAGNYAATWGADPNQAMSFMLRGVGALAGVELSGERMSVAYEKRDQEDEHSCFSDTTTNDLLNNAIGLQNVYLGRYGAVDGPGLDDLVRARDAALDQRLREQLQASIDAIRAIPAPFDQAIQGDNASAGRVAIARGIASLRQVRDSVVQVATRLGLRLNLEG
ncbi:MAG: Iron-regulated protein precursor, partial [Myxococcaceae bacterium]|nr:Iron-regulated protein precursor [Myxococcaceae bacterium]